MKPLNVLSLFDGISCGQVALKNVGILVQNYFASEIDYNAIKITMKNFPNTIQMGDVTKINLERLPKIDLLIGGSPCQGFSFSGKQLNFNDPRSKLFFEFSKAVKFLKKKNPKMKFMLENVRMKKEYQDVISKELGVEPIFLEAALISCVRRPRLYWVNFEIKPLKDLGIFPKDVINKPFCRNALKGFKSKVTKFNSSNEVTDPYVGKFKCFTHNALGNHKRWPAVAVSWNSYRLLSIEEIEKVNGLNSGFTYLPKLKNIHRAAPIGNGWSIQVVEHIFKNLKTQLK